ncbi:MAG: PKD domain-containing protein [Deltaproteobacteria bacterium]|nr:PKD domain-containing protein [Deltaproteobacteria bacterium]
MTWKTAWRFILVICLVTFALMADGHSGLAHADEPIIINHTCTDLSLIPNEWIEQAKLLTIHYAHTSHGSQVTSGAENLETLNSFYSFARRASSTEGLPVEEDPPALRMYDGNPPETYIAPEDYWLTIDGQNRTRAVADTGSYGFSMWSWCGQVSDGNATYIQGYLDTMGQFEIEYPEMRFIFMTGHLDGTDSEGNLHQRNEQIRTYCRENNKVLFDFADIERYDPDGTDYLDLGATDACNYDGGNWADEWCAANPDSDLCASCSCAHSKALNCNQKGRAFWWMMARLAGWPGPGLTADFTADPRTDDLPLTVQFTDISSGEPTSWQWDFGDGSFGFDPDPIHTYTAEGLYTVTLTVANAEGSRTETKPDYIEVDICDNDPVLIESTGLDYTTVQAAYDLADDMDHLLLQALDIEGPIDFNRSIEITLSSGHGCAYDTEPRGAARINGRVTIQGGAVVLGEGCLCICESMQLI